MRSLLLVAFALLVVSGSQAQAEEPTPASDFLPHTPSDWLVIGPLDYRARRPFNSDAVFARHLLDPASPPPKEGETLIGERQKEQAWKKQAADAKGQVGGRIAWAYTTVDSPTDQVVMAWLKSGGTLFVNGTPHAGAIYGDRFEVPVKLVKGTNHIYVKGVRGAFKLTFSVPPAEVFFAPWRQTKPDLVAGEPVDSVAGLLLVNAREAPIEDPLWQAHVPGNDWLAEAYAMSMLPIAPLSIIQIQLDLKTRQGKTAPSEAGPVEISLELRAKDVATSAETTFSLQVRPREKAVIRTFVSHIDGSVQRFGMRTPLPGGSKDKGLVLSLHGAGVNPRGQANAYSRKNDFWLFAPTNRDRFGFDWQDWGRSDAYEVLEQGLKISGVDRSRVYLTGHSMGGHGTWHLGANDPDGFAAIAPSAGWISFDTYPSPRREGELTHIWHAADGASKTRDLLDNLKQLPTFILHGEKDDNVPVDQAREMEKLLTEAGANPETHYEPDKKHWWDGYPEPGAQCVDWPGIYALFRKTRIATSPREIHFRTMDPSVDSKHHWLEVWQALRYGKPCEVRASWDPRQRSLVIQTQNVRTLRLDPSIRPLALNGRRFHADFPKEGLVLVRERESMPWQSSALPDAREKQPAAGGPFKRAFDNGFVLVYGTAGSAAETRALLEQARFDAQRWMYRANGQGLVISDETWDETLPWWLLPGCNAILYGNADTNNLFANADAKRIHGAFDGLPVIRRGRIEHGDVTWRGEDLAGCYVRPGLKDPQALTGLDPGRLVGVCASTGVAGSRLGFTTMLFISGAGWPDYTVFDEGVLTQGDGGVLAAGWYDHAWGIQPDGYVRKSEEPVKPK